MSLIFSNICSMQINKVNYLHYAQLVCKFRKKS